MPKQKPVPSKIKDELLGTVRAIYIERAKHMLMLAAKLIDQKDVGELLAYAEAILRDVKPKATIEEMGFSLQETNSLNHHQARFELSVLWDEIKKMTDPDDILSCARSIHSKIKQRPSLTSEVAIDFSILYNLEFEAEKKRLVEWVKKCRQIVDKIRRGDLALIIEECIEKNPLLDAHNVDTTREELRDWVKQGALEQARITLKKARNYAMKKEGPSGDGPIDTIIERIKAHLVRAEATIEMIGTNEPELAKICRKIHERNAADHLDWVTSQPATLQVFAIDPTMQVICVDLAHTVRNARDLASAKRKLRAALRHWMPLPKKQNTTPNV